MLNLVNDAFNAIDKANDAVMTSFPGYSIDWKNSTSLDIRFIYDVELLGLKGPGDVPLTREDLVRPE